MTPTSGLFFALSFYMDQNNLTDQDNLLTLEMPCLKKSICPHWSPPSRSCLLVKEGLFMPVYQHIASYCLTSNYPSCFQYQLLAGAENEVRQEQPEPINRRRSIRIPSHYSFRFSEISGHDHSPELRDDKTWTIDLSDYGISIASRQQLALNTDIHFLLETEDPAAKAEGTGRVVWCQPLEETTFFQAGIVFIDRPDSTLLPHHRLPNQD